MLALDRKWSCLTCDMIYSIYIRYKIFDSLVYLKSFYLQDDSFLMQPCCSVLQRLLLPLLTALVSFAVQFYRSA